MNGDGDIKWSCGFDFSTCNLKFNPLLKEKIKILSIFCNFKLFEFAHEQEQNLSFLKQVGVFYLCI